MSRKLLVTACAIDGLLTLLFTQLGMFFVGKAHADAAHGVAPQPLALGLSGGGVAAIALILAACLLLHGLWCWRAYRTPQTQGIKSSSTGIFQSVLVVAAPLVALVIGAVLATTLFGK